MLIAPSRLCIFAAFVTLASCATPIDDQTELVVAMPSRSTSSAEVESAIQELIKTYPVCGPVRPLRLVGRPSVNFDPNSSHAPAYEDSEAQLDALAHLGYLTKTAVPELGARAFKFDRTERGKDTTVVGTDRFCLPAERVLVSVTNIERETDATGVDTTGYLLVEFTHTIDPTSVWAKEPDALAKLIAGDQSVLEPGPIKGRALLSRVWLRSEHPLQGAPHSGALWALSYDPVHNRWDGGRWGAVNLRWDGSD